MLTDLRSAMKTINEAVKKTAEAIEWSKGLKSKFNEERELEFQMESERLTRNCKKIIDIGIESRTIIAESVLTEAKKLNDTETL